MRIFNTPWAVVMRSVVAIGALTAALAGCRTPDTGTTGGRFDPYRSTDADVASNRASMPALLELSDQTVEKLALELAGIGPVRGADTRLILELGDLRNLTGTPTQDFELIQHRIRGRLTNSDVINRYFDFVEGAARMDGQLERIMAGRKPSDDATARYDPEVTYVLIGDFLEADRGPARRYYFDFKLVHLASRKIVFHKDFDLAQH